MSAVDGIKTNTVTLIEPNMVKTMIWQNNSLYITRLIKPQKRQYL